MVVSGLESNPLTASAGHHGHSSPRGDGADNLVVAGPLLSTYAKTADNNRSDPPNLVVAIQDTRAMEKAQNGLGISESGTGYTLDGTGAASPATT